MCGIFFGGIVVSSKVIFEVVLKDLSLLVLLCDFFVLMLDFQGLKQLLGNKLIYDEDLKIWLMLFFMVNINICNVYCFNMLLGFVYGCDFVYDEMQIVGLGEEGEVLVKQIVVVNNCLVMQVFLKLGEGLLKEECENGMYDLLFVVIVFDGCQVCVLVKGDCDFGYGLMLKMMVECVVCLLCDVVDVKSGIWILGVVMQYKLIKCLQDYVGLIFVVEVQFD